MKRHEATNVDDVNDKKKQEIFESNFSSSTVSIVWHVTDHK